MCVILEDDGEKGEGRGLFGLSWRGGRSSWEGEGGWDGVVFGCPESVGGREEAQGKGFAGVWV